MLYVRLLETQLGLYPASAQIVSLSYQSFMKVVIMMEKFLVSETNIASDVLNFSRSSHAHNSSKHYIAV